MSSNPAFKQLERELARNLRFSNTTSVMEELIQDIHQLHLQQLQSQSPRARAKAREMQQALSQVTGQKQTEPVLPSTQQRVQIDEIPTRILPTRSTPPQTEPIPVVPITQEVEIVTIPSSPAQFFQQKIIHMVGKYSQERGVPRYIAMSPSNRAFVLEYLPASWAEGYPTATGECIPWHTDKTLNNITFYCM